MPVAEHTVVDFGVTDYETVYAEQKQWVQKRLSDHAPDILLIGEHPHVITTGRGTQPQNLLQPTCPVIEIERGGDVTYHGPGQLVAYPIRKLKAETGERDLHQYLRNLETVIIETLKQLGITGFRREGLTGVWVMDKDNRERKIASIGVAVKQWVTYHGIALNIDTDLGYFRQINPCGLESQVMTSVNELMGKSFAVNDIKPTFIEVYRRVFEPRAALEASM